MYEEGFRKPTEKQHNNWDTGPDFKPRLPKYETGVQSGDSIIRSWGASKGQTFKYIGQTSVRPSPVPPNWASYKKL
jgi:hypothetical protein